MKLLLFLLLLPFLLAAQPGREVVFSGRIIDQQTGRGLPGVTVRIVDGGEDITNDDGVFRITLPRGMTEVRVVVPNGWTVVYPEGGQAPVPADASYLMPFTVKQLQNRIDQLEQTVRRLQRENKLKEVQIDSLRRAVADSVQIWRRQLDAQRLSQTAAEDSLRRRIERLSAEMENTSVLENKRAAYRSISTELLNYLYRLKDLRDWLPQAPDVLLFPNQMARMDTVTGRYNAVHAPLYRHHADHVDQVRKYWEDPELVQKTEEVYTLALHRIHDQIILPTNESVMQPVRDYFAGRKTRLAAQKQVKKGSVDAVNRLAAPVQELEREILVLNELLSRVE